MYLFKLICQLKISSQNHLCAYNLPHSNLEINIVWFRCSFLKSDARSLFEVLHGCFDGNSRRLVNSLSEITTTLGDMHSY